MNKRRLRGTHSVFKSVFDQSDKQQRSDQHTFPIVRQIDLQLYISRQPQTHQLDITLHEIQFMIERYEFLIVFIQHMPQQPAQIMDGKLGPVRIDSDQGINIIKGIEQEMRVQLAFQILQFRFGTAFSNSFFSCSRIYQFSVIRIATLRADTKAIITPSRIIKTLRGGKGLECLGPSLTK